MKRRVRSDRRKKSSTKAGEYVREEMHQLSRGKRGPKTRKQAIAIGLSRARRAGIPVKKKKR